MGYSLNSLKGLYWGGSNIGVIKGDTLAHMGAALHQILQLLLKGVSRMVQDVLLPQ